MPTRETILIADDDQAMVRLVRRFLEEKGFTVLVAHEGQTAIHTARTQSPNLIILDVDMPVLNGLKTFQFLRELPATQHIPVIFVTASASALLYPLLDRFPRLGYLKKPVDLDHLQSMIRHFLRQYATA